MNLNCLQIFSVSLKIRLQRLMVTLSLTPLTEWLFDCWTVIFPVFREDVRAIVRSVGQLQGGSRQQVSTQGSISPSIPSTTTISIASISPSLQNPPEHLWRIVHQNHCQAGTTLYHLKPLPTPSLFSFSGGRSYRTWVLKPK